MSDAIRFSATVAQVKTMADGGLRVAFDLSESALDAVRQLMESKVRGAVLEVAAVAIEPTKVMETDGNERRFTRHPTYAKREAEEAHE